jgi:hypothetical protein
MPSYNLIVVTGCMRSGTSLLYSLLCTSPDAGPPMAPARYLADNLNLYRRYVGVDRSFADDYFTADNDIMATTRRFLRERLDAAWENCGRPRCLIVRSVDLAHMIPLAAGLLPDARFVISVRDPRDTITSMIKVARKQKLLRVEKTGAVVSRDVAGLCKAYNASYLPALRLLRQHPELNERINFVRYEDAARDAASAFGPLWQQLGLRQGTLAPTALTRRPSLLQLATHRYWRTYITELHNGPASTESVGSHGAFLAKAEASLIERRCRHLAQRFGYDGRP